MSEKMNLKKRESRLKEEFQIITKGIASLHNAIILFRTEGKDMPPSKYVFELNIKTISNIDDIGKPEFIEKVYFQVEIPENFPFESPIGKFVNQTKIFHPHVKISSSKLPFLNIFSSIQWVDYLPNEDETILEFVFRITKSLQFRPDYIDAGTEHVGNQKALDWYLHYSKKNSGEFPIDDTPLFSKPILEIIDATNKREVNKIGKNEPQTHELPSKAFNIRGTPPKKKFNIQQTSDPYRPQNKKKRTINKANGYKTDFRLGQSNHELLIEEEAGISMFNHIDWGKKTNINKVEQGGLLLGDVFFDPSMQAYEGIVSKIIPARNTLGTNVYLDLNHEVWKKMIDEIDELKDKEGYEGQVMGWYHTHPNMLDVFMSDTDINTQRRMFPHDWQFAIVLNPHLQIWRSFRGFDIDECHGFIEGTIIDTFEVAIPNPKRIFIKRVFKMNKVIRFIDFLNSDRLTIFLIVLCVILGLIWIYLLKKPDFFYLF